jgi:hypothetical protein
VYFKEIGIGDRGTGEGEGVLLGGVMNCSSNCWKAFSWSGDVTVGDARSMSWPTGGEIGGVENIFSALAVFAGSSGLPMLRSDVLDSGRDLRFGRPVLRRKQKFKITNRN